MGVTSKCDFYCDLEKINALGEKYQTAIQTLGELYNDVQDAILEVSSQSYLSGKWYDAFVEEFETWSEWHYRGLAMLILLNSALGSIYLSVESLITIRNQLNDYI